jgi:UDP-hydrolysing UDP-N-acetyl-D-glucosamine 2-epimerase
MIRLRIGVITAGRSDFGIYLPVLRAIRANPALELVLIAAGTHMEPRFGETIRDIEAAGFAADYRVPLVPETDDAAAVAAAMGRGMIAFSEVYRTAKLDLVMLLGDRFEMFAAASAAVPFTLPLVHLHGGEVTEGAMDEQFRHAISKLSHLHFVAAETYRGRLLQLGEEPWRVTVSGAPGLDHLAGFVPWSLKDLEKSLQMNLKSPFVLITFHPVTLHAEEQVDTVLRSLPSIQGCAFVITGPNSDPGHSRINEKLQMFVEQHPQARLFPSLGTARYFSLMHHATAMIGNSSSGIIEAASFELPVVNIGDRQKGRVRGRNVIDVPCEQAAIEAGLRRAMALDFRPSLAGMVNPYGNGKAAECIVKKIAATASDARLLHKRFIDGCR